MAIRVLMIDDDEEDCEIVEAYLAEAASDYDFESITELDQAAKRMLAAEHDVYLLDHRMGEERGVDFLGRLREQGFRKPVVLCSGGLDRDARMDATMFGVSDILSKNTLSPVSLENSIRFALSRGERKSY